MVALKKKVISRPNERSYEIPSLWKKWFSNYWPFLPPSVLTSVVSVGCQKLKQLLSFAIGGLLGDVFLHLLPEAWGNSGSSGVSPFHQDHIPTFFLKVFFFLWPIFLLNMRITILAEMFSFEIICSSGIK